MLADPNECQPAIGDETVQDALKRCSAKIPTNVRRPSSTESVPESPVNPSGTIRELTTDSERTEYAVFTPEEGGKFAGDGFSLMVTPGSVPNSEYTGVRVTSGGDASNAGKTWQRFTLVGSKYDIGVLDASGEAILSDTLADPASVCVPLPAELVDNIAGVMLSPIGEDEELTVLSTNVKIGSGGISVCGAVSTVPATVAVGSTGAPATIVEPEAVEDERMPDTGGKTLTTSILLVVLLLGIPIAFVGVMMFRSARPRGLLD